ncbi:MAG: hydroxysqualene dehydroxylase HpnE [Planctomycetaceae bacterium]|nr:hydroxysqualene dehydroxylase HpnE [Planctomycetaceae bacterium]
MKQTQHNSETIAVIGGGMSGIAAAEAAVRHWQRVELFEWSQVLGGRLMSMKEPKTGRWIDNGQHILLGCCSEAIALHERLGLTRCFDRYDSLPFMSSDNKSWTLSASPFLPNRWQLVPSFLKMPFLSFSDRLSTGLLLRKLGKVFSSKTQSQSFDEPFIERLQREHASNESIEKFWKPLVLSTLSDTLESVSCNAVCKVIRDGFMSGSDAMTAWIPNKPLREIYAEMASESLVKLGVTIHTGKKIELLEWQNYSDDGCTNQTDSDDDAVACNITGIRLNDGTCRRFDRYVVATPWHSTWQLLEKSNMGSLAEMLGLDRFEAGAVTTIHLWCDRRLLPENQGYCAILGQPGQVLFCPKHCNCTAENGSELVYHTVVVSASHRLLSETEMTSRGNAELVSKVQQQLDKIFRVEFKIEHWRVTTVFDAVFSPSTQIFTNRPTQQTPIKNLSLAGDWTQTTWPATIEGAVRSGILAIE